MKLKAALRWLVAAVALYLVMAHGVLPYWDRLGELNRLITEREKKLTELEVQRNMLKEISKNLPKKEKSKNSQSEIGTLWEWIEKRSKQAGLVLRQMRPQGVREKKGEREYRLSLVAEGDLNQIGQFLFFIKNSFGLYRIDAMTLRPTGNEEGSKLILQASISQRVR